MKRWNRMLYQPNLPLGADGRKVTAGEEHIALSRRAAREGMVLLKNDGTLPLRAGSRIALFGKGTFDYVKGGGGSGDVTVPWVKNLSDGFDAYPGRVFVHEETRRFYRDCVRAQYDAGRLPGFVEEPDLPDDLLKRAAAFADIAVISISRFSGESWDRKSAFDTIPHHKGVAENLVAQASALFPKGDFVLTDREAEMVRKVTRAFRRTVVVLNVGGMFDVSVFRDDPAVGGVLLGWQAGLEGGIAEAELLLGLYNPSGKLSDTFARTLEDYPSSPTFYASDDHVDYVEDIYVGYRYFETIPGAREKVCYPFGYGLSYTRFAFDELTVRQDDADAEFVLWVTNVGAMAGREVVQVYFSAPQGRLGKPTRALIGYQKTRLLQPGERQRIAIRCPIDQMASYDDTGRVAKSAWVMEAGTYRFFIGTDVESAVECDWSYTEPADRVVEALTERLKPKQLPRRLRADGTWEELPTSADAPREEILPPFDMKRVDGLRPAVRAVPPLFHGAKSPNGMLEDVAEGRVRLEDFVSGLSDADLAHLLGGQPNVGVANTYGYGNMPEYGIPNAMTADGPAGLRIRPEVGVVATAFPCATLLACTWDPDVCESVGAAAAQELKENNIAVWLAPAINIHRNPLCGRNFEYYSEDPFLTARQAGAMVRGIQSQGIAATIKHFALNNKETNRRNSDSRASERAIREIYLRAFEWIVKECHPWSLMTSYNIINGTRASENADLVDGILRGEWGYDGLVVTDWYGYGEQYREVAAGGDVKMGIGFPDRLLEALRLGGVTREAMERSAAHVLKLILRVDC